MTSAGRVLILGAVGVAAVSSGPGVCDAISLCDGGACPAGMELVGPPERTETYVLESDSTSWSPGELIALRIKVTAPQIQAKRHAGQVQCACTGVCETTAASFAVNNMLRRRRVQTTTPPVPQYTAQKCAKRGPEFADDVPATTIEECLAAALLTDGCGPAIQWREGRGTCRCCEADGASGGEADDRYDIYTSEAGTGDATVASLSSAKLCNCSGPVLDELGQAVDPSVCAADPTAPFMETSKYLGVLLYAVKANDPDETKVGSWEMPIESAPRFISQRSCDSTDANCVESCHGKALVQTSARQKRYTERFWFRAPEKGTGPIVFRALLKQGETLGGGFYWPSTGNGNAPSQAGVVAGDLMLPEVDPTARSIYWFRGDPGVSCDAVCDANGGRECDEGSFADAASAEGFLSAVASSYLCAPPLLQACNAYAPSTSGYGDSWCWFADASTCPAASQCAAEPPAADAELFGLRFCPCAAGRRLAELGEPPMVPAVDEDPCTEDPDAGTLPLPAFHVPLDVARKNASKPCPFGADYRSATSAASTAATRRVSSARMLTGGYVSRAASPIFMMPSLLVLATCSLVAVALATLLLRGNAAPGGGAPPLVLATRLLALDAVSAHNWINSPASRATKASQVSPCIQRTSSAPHVRVNANQEFPVEWASGHPGSYHYFAVLKATDEGMMTTHSESLFEDYVASAPAGSSSQPHKMHYGWTATSRAGGDEPTHQNFLEQGLTEVATTAAEWMERPEAFACANYGSVRGSFSDPSDCVQVSDLTLYNYPASERSEDKLASYVSAAYPHLEAVHVYKAIKPTDDKNGFPKQFDTARFSIPARGGPGMYIVQYFWRGYRDCIDVEVLAEPVGTGSGNMFGIGTYTNVDGDPVDVEIPSEPTYAMLKIDHCQYRKGLFTLIETTVNGASVCHPVPPPEATNSQGQTRDEALEACTERCKADDGCQAVNIVPATSAPSLAFRGAANQNVPWDTTVCVEAAFSTEPAGTAVCYGLVPTELDSETSEAYVIVDDDPEDEIFFSTCYNKKMLTGFDLLLPPTPLAPPPPAPWSVGGYCLSCEDAHTAPLTGYWELADACEMCWRENLTLPPGIPGGPTIAGSANSSSGETIGIATGAAVVALLVCAFAAGIFFWRRGRRRRELQSSTLAVKQPAMPAVAPPISTGLPPGWTACVDPSSGATYYHNAGTGETQWEVPNAHV